MMSITISRHLEKRINSLLQGFPALSLTGPRQSGKTTLLQTFFPSYTYISLETPENRAQAIDDPRFFLDSIGEYVIIDEAQRAPELFSYLQERIDSSNAPGRFILSGSQNFLLSQSIQQSLAGRVGIVRLLPFSYNELPQPPQSFDEWIFTGGYPRLYSSPLTPVDYYPSYTQTYLERDVRTEMGVRNLSAFHTFLQLCATHIGSPLNLTALANACNVSVKTAQNWFSALEESYIIFRLPPWHSNLSKRVIKKPKLYFWDTGLACHLLGFTSERDYVKSDMKGALFENATIVELAKQYLNRGYEPSFHYWRDSNGHEIDLLITKGMTTVAGCEIKATHTYKPGAFKHLDAFGDDFSLTPTKRFLIYAGNRPMPTKHGIVHNISTLPDLYTSLEQL